MIELPQPGSIFADKYKLLDSLGAGGFAHVFRALDVEINRTVAIKVLAPRDGRYDEKVVKRFMREAKVVGQLQSPNTITMYDYGRTEDGLLFMVFQFLEAQDLEEVIKSVGALPDTVAEHVLRQILASLHEAHGLGVMHRDIKPANVLVFAHLDDSYSVKLIDFGIARVLQGERRPDLTKLTADGTVIGTPRYMAPELLVGDVATPQSDIYAAGLVVFEMLAGRPAIAGDGPEIVREQLSPQPIALAPAVAASKMSAVIARMIAREPAERFAHVTEVIAALDAAVRSPSGARQAPHRAPYGTSPPVHHAPSAPSWDRPPLQASQSWEGPIVVAQPRRFSNRAALAAAATLTLLMTLTLALIVVTKRRDAPEPQTRLPGAIVRTSPVPQPEPQPAGADQTAVAAPTPDVAAECGKGETGVLAGAVVSGLDRRNYFAYVPISDHVERSPVVLITHRLGQADDFFTGSRLTAVAESAGLVMISLYVRDTEEPQHIADAFGEAMNDIGASTCLDRTRVFLLGHGAGGRVARNLRCVMPLSAVATTGDGHFENEKFCETNPPVPFMRIYGLEDEHVPLDRSPSCSGKGPYQTPSAVESGWRKRNECQEEATVWLKNDRGTCSTWACEAPFVSCAVSGGHDWPGAPLRFERPSCMGPPMNFSVGETVWRFFLEFGRVLPAP